MLTEIAYLLKCPFIEQNNDHGIIYPELTLQEIAKTPELEVGLALILLPPREAELAGVVVYLHRLVLS